MRKQWQLLHNLLKVPGRQMKQQRSQASAGKGGRNSNYSRQKSLQSCNKSKSQDKQKRRMIKEASKSFGLFNECYWPERQERTEISEGNVAFM